MLDAEFLSRPLCPGGADDGPVPLQFVQAFFFLIFFRSALETVGVQPPSLDLYSELDFCIQGTVTAADNLFDGEAKRLLPLRPAGRRLGSVLQLLCFQRLIQRSFERAVAAGVVPGATGERIQRELLSRMAEIGALEGSEETGVERVLEVDDMVERVHRVRGGKLFALAFVAPRLVESPRLRHAVAALEGAMSRLGTAFQMVDDLTDFEFDARRRRHNLLVAEIHRSGTVDDRLTLRRFQEGGEAPARWPERFREPARAVLRRAQAEARRGLEDLRSLGFWFPPSLAEGLVGALAGDPGAAVMESLAPR